MDRELTVQIEQVIATLRKHVFASFQYITLKLGKLTDSKTLFLVMLMVFCKLGPRKKLKAIVKGTLNNTKLTVGCLRSVPSRRKGDVTRDDSQRRLLAQHRVAMLEQCCSRWKKC